MQPACLSHPDSPYGTWWLVVEPWSPAATLDKPSCSASGPWTGNMTRPSLKSVAEACSRTAIAMSDGCQRDLNLALGQGSKSYQHASTSEHGSPCSSQQAASKHSSPCSPCSNYQPQ